MCSPITGLVEDQPTPHGAPPKKEQVMRTYDLSRVSDAALVRKLTVLLAEERISMAAVLAYLAEVDARRLYLPAGFPSMYAYCVGELHLCEQAAMKHIRAARTAPRFPVIFSAVADRPAASPPGGAADCPPDLGPRGRARGRRRVPC